MVRRLNHRGRQNQALRSWTLMVYLVCLFHEALAQGQHKERDRKFAPTRWWCTPERGHADGTFCRTAALREAIAMAEPGDDKQARVEELKTAIRDGRAEAEGLDATNPERQRAMEAWCASDDPVRIDDKKATFVCAKAKAKGDFFRRREELLAYWCGEMGHAGSPKCKQMEFGKRMQQTESGEERKRMAMEFKGATTAEEQSVLDTETKEMMQSVCASSRAETPIFSNTCAKLQTT